jgi:PAS domain S-box-containing protein
MRNLLLGVSNANNHLLKEISIDDALNRCIAAIGQSQGIDRCYIFKNKTENQDLKLYYVYEWCNEGIDAYLGHPDLNGASYDDFPGLYDPLSKDEPLYGLVKESDNKMFVETMEMQGIKSYLFTPIFSENKFWGFIGYDDCKKEKKWIEEQVYVLHTVAKNIGIRLNQDKTKAKLEAHLEKFDFYIKGSNQGMWEWDIKTNQTIFSYNWAGMIGYNLDEIEQSYEFWRRNVHPDDIERIEDDIRKYLNGRSDSYTGIHRLKNKNGHYVWTKGSGLIIKNVDGSPGKLIGTHIDISELKEKERELQLSEEKFRFITENTTDLICQNFVDGTFFYVSGSSEDIVGYKPVELLNKSFFDLIHPDERNFVKKSLFELSKLPFKTLTFPVKRKDNGYVWLESTVKVILDDKDKIIGVQSSCRDISERIRAAEEMRLNLVKEKELNELKSKFVSMASHQFKTPMTIIYSNAELIELKYKTDKNNNYQGLGLITKRIKSELDRLNDIINNILIFEKYEHQEVKKYSKNIDLEHFINKIIETYFSNEPDGRKITTIVKGHK